MDSLKAKNLFPFCFLYSFEFFLLKSSKLLDLSAKIPNTPAAVISTDKKFITFLKLRLEFVAMGEFECPNNEITDPLKVE